MRHIPSRRTVGMLPLFWLMLTLLASPANAQSAGSKATVVAGKQVSLEYTLKLDDQSVFESNVGEAPLIYTHGGQKLVPGLEKALEGMAVGDTKHVTVTPAEGYGEPDPEAFQEVEKQLIPPDALHIGAQLEGKTPDGQSVYPKVAAVKADTVVLDFNHPLAGKTLHFDVKVLDVQEGPSRH